MAYIGAQIENRISPAFIKEDFTGNGSDTVFTLTNEVPGGASQNVMVMVNVLYHVLVIVLLNVNALIKIIMDGVQTLVVN